MEISTKFSNKDEKSHFKCLMKLVLVTKVCPEVIPIIKSILQKYPNIINQTDHKKETLLIVSCLHYLKLTSLECIKLLIEYGADVNSTDVGGGTPLLFVCRYASSSTECIKLLIEHGADVNSTDDNDDTPLLFVCQDSKSPVECIKLLINHGAKINFANRIKSPLYFMYLNNMSTEFTKLLIESNIDLNESLKVLCTRPQNIEVECARCLINVGADVNKRVGRETILFTACHNYCDDPTIKLIQLLLDNKANVNEMSYHGNTCLILCVDKIDINPLSLDRVRILINAGADVNLKNKKGFNALMTAFRNFRISKLYDVIKLLIDAGTDCDISSDKKIIPLMFFCKFEKFSETSLPTLMLLINKTTSINVVDYKSRTAYDYFKANPTHINITNDHIETLLTTNVRFFNTKSAKCIL